MLSLQSEYRLISHLIKSMLETYGKECYNPKSEISQRFEELKAHRSEIRIKIMLMKDK